MWMQYKNYNARVELKIVKVGSIEQNIMIFIQQVVHFRFFMQFIIIKKLI